MKLPFCSVAVIAMSLLSACSSNSNKLNDITDYSSGKSEENVQTQDIQLQSPESQNATPSRLGTIDNFATKTLDTTTGQYNPSILNAAGPANKDWDKKIIKTAKVTLELKDFTSFNAAIHDNLKRYGAYIANEQQTESDMRMQNVLSIKVPVAQFEDLMNSIGGNDIQVLEKSIGTEDATGEVIDTKARIAAKQQVRDQYMELLKQAKTMKDILAVQAEINNIQEDLEAASGRVAYLSHSAAYSTINLTYYQYINGNSSDTVEPSFLTKINEAFATGGTIITNLILFTISIWPMIVAAVVTLVYIKRGRLKKA